MNNTPEENDPDFIPDINIESVDSTDFVGSNKHIPLSEQIRLLEQELVKRQTGPSVRKIIFGTFKSLIVIAAAVVLVTNLLISVMIVSRSSMTPVLRDGDVVIALRWFGVKPGDIIAFYYNNIIQIKRVIAKEGDWIDIKEDGTVYVNDNALDEPYLTDKYFGECDIELPYQVPVGSVFVMGDQRKTSADSRLKEIGPVRKENILGKVFIGIWPLSRIKTF